ncbi:MAG: T9SS type A sorting domain-containing protein [Bacteroidota bacterium]
MKTHALRKQLTLITLLLSQVFYLSAQCDGDYYYNELNITNNWTSCRQNFLTKTITINFPSTHATDPETGVPYGVEVDFWNGYQYVPPSLTTTITYPVAGEWSVSVRACNVDGHCFINHSIGFEIKATTQDYYSPDLVLDLSVPGTVTWSPPAGCNPYADNSDGYLGSSIGKGKAYIKYAPGHSALVKPIIFVDGLDFTGSKIVRDAGVGGDEIIRYGSTGWDVVATGSSEGFNSPHSNYPNSEFYLYPQAFQEMYDLGYDIVYIDFERGADYIQKNGLLLIEAIKDLNQLKQTDPVTGVTYQNVIAGASMGGQIARWALTTMENEGTCHETGTYLSFDSPHKGANIPLALQAAAWYSFQTGDNTSLWNKLNRPATRQLLVEHFGNALQDGRLSAEVWTTGSEVYNIETNFDYGCLRTSYADEMETLGYPNATRNIAISCGSKTGIDQGYAAGDKLYHGQFEADVIENIADFGTAFRSGVWALNGGSTNGLWGVKFKSIVPGCQPDDGHWFLMNPNDLLFVMAKPNDDSNLWCDELFPYAYNSIAVKSQYDYPHYDNAPGCYRYDLFDLASEISEALKGEPGDDISYLVSGKYQQCFMPTMSTLDIDWTMNTTGMWQDISAYDIIGTNKTPFEAYYAPDNNLKHVEMDQGMIDWIVAQLDIADELAIDDLPSAQGNTYNVGIEGSNRIPGININNGGTLRVNDLGATKYLNGPNTTMSTFTAYLSGCASVINIESGGRFILGNDAGPNGDRKADVYVKKGSVVHVKDGGILRLARGSRLIVEEGAQLIIDDGARIDLWWSESTIVVRGELVINGDFTFVGSGFFQFDPDHILSLNANFNLTGQFDRFMRINAGATLDIAGMGISLERGTVEFATDGQIKIGQGGRLHTDRVVFKNIGSSNSVVSTTALSLKGPQEVDLFFTKFEYLGTAMEISEFENAESVKLDFCRFENNRNGILAFDGNQMTLQTCTFDAKAEGVNAIYAVNISDIDLNGSSLNDYKGQLSAVHLYNVDDAYVGGTNFRNNKSAVSLEDVFSYRMHGGRIELTQEYGNPNGTIGIKAPYSHNSNVTNIYLRENAIIQNQDIGIQVAKGGVLPFFGSVYGKVLMDCAKLINNDTGIQGEDVTLEIDAFVHCNCTSLEDAKSNSFIKSAWASALADHFDICYRDISIPNGIISAQGNYWSGGSGSTSYDIRQAGQEQFCHQGTPITVLNSIQATEEPTSCTSDDVVVVKRSSDDGPVLSELSGNLLKVYPNPFDDLIYLDINAKKAGQLWVQITDLLGQQIKNERIPFAAGEQQVTIQMEANLPSGIYYLQVKNEDQREQSFKLLHVQNN